MSPQAGSNSEKHNAIEKALSILGLFAFENEELGTIEISKKLGYHKATTSRTLILLSEYGYLDQNERSKKYRLGQRIVDLGLSLTRSLKRDLVQIAKPYLEDLRNRIQETIVFEVSLGKRTMIAYIAEGPSILQLGGEVGELMPSPVTAGSKALLAFSPVNEWDQFLEKKLPRLTPNSITDKAKFKKHLSKIKETGIATDFGENDFEIHAIACPILNIEAIPVAAVDVVGLANRFKPDLHSAATIELKATADKISKRLYYSQLETNTLEDWLAAIRIQ